jgi:hypothetical protein
LEEIAFSQAIATDILTLTATVIEHWLHKLAR